MLEMVTGLFGVIDEKYYLLIVYACSYTVLKIKQLNSILKMKFLLNYKIGTRQITINITILQSIQNVITW